MDEWTATPAPEEKNAVFARVWSRVMEGREDSLVSPCAPLPPPEAPSPAPKEQPPQVCETPAMLPPELSGSMGKRSDFPTGQGSVLSKASQACVPLLQTLLRRALQDSREYQLLARRTGGSPARVLQALASEKLRHAKALSTACFLISGVRYWPETGKAAPPTSYLGALRRRFHWEQETVALYLAAVEETADPCLRDLFLDCAKAAWDSACRLRTLVEQVF